MELAAISLDGVIDAQEMTSLVGVKFPVLADPEGVATKAYKVHNLLGDGVATPSSFIITSDGKIAWRHIGENIQDRPTPDQILQQLAALGY